MPTATRTRMTQDAINELIAKRVDEAWKAYDAARNLETKAEIKECTYQDFVKCQPLNFKGTEGVIGLTRWFKKMETVFHISNFPPRCQVKYATCTLQDGALTWLNSHKRTIRVNDAYAITWKALIKLMTVDAIRVANNLMDQKLKGYAIKNAENKRMNNVERKGYAGVLPYCNKCRMYHEGPCMARCGNYKRVGHLTRDYRTVVAATPQRALLKNQNYRHKTGNKNGNNEAKARAYTIGGGGVGPDSNIITGTFLLNNRYASMLFDLGADRSFMSTTFSALLDVIPSTLDTSYVAFVIFLLLDFMTLTFEEDIDSEVRKLHLLSFLDVFKPLSMNNIVFSKLSAINGFDMSLP
ncbi:hypothetical protein Tco_1394886 [Tanacetum coccineum]